MTKDQIVTKSLNIDIKKVLEVLHYKGYPSKEHLPNYLNWKEVEKLIDFVKSVQNN